MVMKKNYLYLFILFLSFGIQSSVLAYDFEVDGICYTIKSSQEKTVTVSRKNSDYSSSEGYSGQINIPERVSYNGNRYSVIGIDGYAFVNCDKITSVSIPSSVITIGAAAFQSCSSLTSIEIPDGVKTLDYYVFSLCSSLTSISIPKSTNLIKGKILYGCNNLKSIIVDKDNTVYDSRDNCNALIETSTNTILEGCQYTVIPESVTTIGKSAFKGCKGLTSLNIPSNIISIESSAFAECSELISIVVSEDNKKYDSRNNCNAIIETSSNTLITGCKNTIIPDNVTCIGYSAFMGCVGLKTINIPNSVTSIEGYAFRECTNLTSAIIGNSVKSIDLYAFSGTSLKSIIIPNSVISIGPYAFQCSPEMTSVSIGKNVTTIDNTAFQDCNITSVTINNNFIPSNTYSNSSTLANIFGSQVNEYVFGESVKSIGSYACYGCTALTSVSIHRDVNYIGDNTFCGCTGLTSITIPEDLISIGKEAFKNCINLKSIIINSNTLASHTYTPSSNLSTIFGEQVTEYIFGESVNSIGQYAFQGCKGIANVSFGNGLTLIDDYAFNGCNGLASVSIPNSVTSLGRNVFENCTDLASVTIGNNVKSIGQETFKNCSRLTSVFIPESMSSIGNNAFMGCSSLTKAEFASIENLCSISFANNDANPLGNAHHLYINGTEVKNLVIPESVDKIGNYAFYGCSDLSSVSIGKGVKSIGKFSFSGCNNLVSVTINSNTIASESYSSTSTLSGMFGEHVTEYVLGEGVNSIGQYAFYGAKEVSSISIPNSVTSIGNNAFCGCSGLTSLNFPNNTTSIGNSAFSGCIGLTSVQVPEKVTSMGVSVFSNCSNLKSVDINNSIIGESMFSGCIGLSSVNIHENVKTIGGSAFYECKSLSSLILPDEISTIGNNAFPSITSLYVKRGVKTLLTLWNKGYVEPYETGTTKVLTPSTLSLEGTTQMTATVKVNNFYSDFTNTLNDEIIENESRTFNLRPEYSGRVTLKVSKDDVVYTPNSISFTTKSISPTAKRIEGTASSIFAEASYLEGDAPVTAQKLTLNGVTVEDNSIYLNGLRPGYSYPATYTITVDGEYEYSGTTYLKTDYLNFTNSQPKVISEGDVIVSSSSNLDDGETNVGFEWRRTDWTSDFQSNVAGAYLYEGTIEGYIRNMNTNFLWKFRPYYEANDGSRYYGDWLGIDPTNTSYFEPTVHTYAKIEVNGNSAKVKGYAMRGSDNITSQGFMYWRNSAGSSSARLVPSSAVTVEAKGQIMTSELKGLDYLTDYRIVAYVTTSEGETFYGEEQSFKTEDAQTGIEEVEIEETKSLGNEGIYDLSGRKLARMQKGINIIRFKDGTTKKVLVK